MRGVADTRASAAGGNLSDYLQLVKPRLTSMALATTLVGFFMASPGDVDHAALLFALAGAALIGAGANGLNQYLERDIDARMKRTEARPLPAGRLAEKTVLFFAFACAALGTAILASAVNALTAVLGVVTFASYAFVYTPLKKITPLNTYVGAFPGALPSVMGWTAARNSLDGGALALFAILYVWQLPHFYSIAWVYRDDYVRGGLRMVAEHDKSGLTTSLRILLFCGVLVPVSALPTLAGIAGWAYFLAAMILGTVFFALAARLVQKRMDGAKAFVSVSIFYLMAIIVTLIADKA
jgi:heme o synthase